MSIGGNRRVAFFLKEKNNAIGGMETHANQFVKYFDRINMLRFIVYDHFIYEITATGMKEVQYEDIDFLIGYLYKNKIDTLFFNNGQWIEYFSVFRKYFPDAKLIMRSGGNEFMKAPIDDMSISLVKRRRIWAECINQLDFIIANSAFTLHRMQAIGIKREKIILVRGGVDVNFCNDNYVSRLKNKKEFCEKYNIKDGNILLGIISRFEEFKGIEQTLNVLKNYKEQKWHLIVAGEGKLRLEIKTFLKNNFDDCRYTFLGKLNNDESIKVISILDYLLNLSVVFKRKSGNELYEHTETMGRSMLEAICCNVPIISTDVGGAAEWFVENVKIGY